MKSSWSFNGCPVNKIIKKKKGERRRGGKKNSEIPRGNPYHKPMVYPTLGSSLGIRLEEDGSARGRQDTQQKNKICSSFIKFKYMLITSYKDSKT